MSIRLTALTVTSFNRGSAGAFHGLHRLIRRRFMSLSGVVGGLLVGIVVMVASFSLFAHIDEVKDSDIPMLAIVNSISPVVAYVHSIAIFALIFNTAFSAPEHWVSPGWVSDYANGGLRPDTEVLCPALPNDQYRSGVDFAGMRLEYVAGLGLSVSMFKASFSLEVGLRRGGFRCFLAVGQSRRRCHRMVGGRSRSLALRLDGRNPAVCEGRCGILRTVI